MNDREVFIVSAVRSPTGNYLCAFHMGFAFEPVRLIKQDTKCKWECVEQTFENCRERVDSKLTSHCLLYQNVKCQKRICRLRRFHLLMSYGIIFGEIQRIVNKYFIWRRINLDL
jgi:hypothetical protein